MSAATRMDRTRCFSLSATYRFAPCALRHAPAIFIPFLIFAVVELACLGVLYYAPRQPWSAVLGPPIRAFWGEAFLHYPANFLLLPHLVSLARTVLYVLVGSLLNGIAVLSVRYAYAGGIAGPVVGKAVRRYGALCMVSLLSAGAFMLFSRLFGLANSLYFVHHSALLWIPARIWLGPVAFLANLLASISIQALFIYAIPAMMIDDAGLFKAIAGSVRLCRRMFLPTVTLIVIPVLVYVPIMVLQYKTPYFVNLNPESVVYIAASGALINSLFVDVLVTVSITYLYLTARE